MHTQDNFTSRLKNIQRKLIDFIINTNCTSTFNNYLSPSISFDNSPFWKYIAQWLKKNKKIYMGVNDKILIFISSDMHYLQLFQFHFSEAQIIPSSDKILHNIFCVFAKFKHTRFWVSQEILTDRETNNTNWVI